MQFGISQDKFRSKLIANSFKSYRIKSLKKSACHNIASAKNYIVQHNQILGRNVAPLKAYEANLDDKAASPFDPAKNTQGLQTILIKTPNVVLYALIAVAALGGGAVGYSLDTIIKKELPKFVKVGLTVAFSYGFATVAGSLVRQRQGLALLELQKYLYSLPDASTIDSKVIEQICKTFGIKKFSDQLLLDMQNILAQFIESLIPKGSDPLRGDEHEKIQHFMDAIQLTGEEAAPAFIEVGRRVERAGAESGEAGSRRVLYKLIYVSNQLYGDRSYFLLPWRRMFSLKDAQVEVAMRESAKQLFQNHIAEAYDGELVDSWDQLTELKLFQKRVKLNDKFAEDVVQEIMRQQFKKVIKEASGRLKKKDQSDELFSMLSTHVNILQSLIKVGEEESQKEDSKIIPGLKFVSLKQLGEKEKVQYSDLKQVYQFYIENSLEKDVVDEDLLSQWKQLASFLGLSLKDAEDIVATKQSDRYTELLRESFKSEEIVNAPSKAAVLNRILNETGIGQKEAFNVNKGIYLQILKRALEDKKIDDEEEKTLKNFRQYLCLTTETWKAMQSQACGKIYGERLKGLLELGIERFDFDEILSMQQTLIDLRLDTETATNILKTETIKIFDKFIKQARAKSSQTDVNKEIRNMILFSNQVISPLLFMAKGGTFFTKEYKDYQAEMAKKGPVFTEDKAPEAEKVTADDEAEVNKMIDQLETQAITKDQGQSQPEEEQVKAASAESPQEAAKPDDTGAKTENAPVAEGAKAEEGEKPVVEGAQQEEKVEEVKAEKVEPEKPKKPEEPLDILARVRNNGQREITLVNALDEKNRIETYKSYMVFAMQGEQQTLAFGQTVSMGRNPQEFVRLEQLGGILGLRPDQVAAINREFSEKIFSNEAEKVMQSGQLTKQKIQQLEDLAKQLSLPSDSTAKLVKKVDSQKLVGVLKQKLQANQLTLQSVLEFKDQGVEVEKHINENLKETLYRKEVERVLSNGEGAFDKQKMEQQIPQDISFDPKKAHSVVEKAVGSRRLTLVQGVSFLRQNNPQGAYKTINNFVAMDQAIPLKEPEPWKDRGELLSLYECFSEFEKSEEKRAVVQRLLGITEEEKELVLKAPKGKQQQEQKKDFTLF